VSLFARLAGGGPGWRGRGWRGWAQPDAELRAVPGWGDVDLPWREAEFVVVDLETTGLDLRRDQIVSYGGIVVRGGRAVVDSCVYGLVRPTRPVSRAAVEVHALRLEDLADAPLLEDCAHELIDLLAGRVLVAHAAWVEQAFLARALGAGGARLEGPVVDTAALARETLVVRARDEGEPQLERLATGLGLPVHTPHHALGDALTTANVFLALVSRLESREAQTVRSLTTVTRRQSLR
jgi:DNA polymerase-3 subunit epsilon